MSCGVVHRCGLDMVLLWLWCRLAAVSPLGPLASEPPYAMGVALKSRKKKNVGWGGRGGRSEGSLSMEQPGHEGSPWAPVVKLSLPHETLAMYLVSTDLGAVCQLC